MRSLCLEPGGKLIATWDAEGSALPKTEDVSACAHQFLFERVDVSPLFTLGDLFGLLSNDPVLVSIYRRDYSLELLEHALKGPVGQQTEADPEALEFLELYQIVEAETAEQRVSGTEFVRLHGLSFEFKHDTDMGGYIQAKGTRLGYGVSLTDLRELLAVPLRVNLQVAVCEGDPYSRNFGQQLHVVTREPLMLGHLLHAVLWELSFHGSPEEGAEVAADLRETVAELKEQLDSASRPQSRTSEDDSSDFLTCIHNTGVEAVFSHTGTLSIRELADAVRQIEDRVNIVEGLAETLKAQGSGVVIKPQYRALNARDFRKAMNEAGCR